MSPSEDEVSMVLGKSHRHAICTTTIDTLTDDVWLEIFDLIRSSRSAYCQVRFYPVWEWHTLASVCRRWREIIFASPLRLDLQLLCTHGTPVRKDLGYWPSTFPIAISYGYGSGSLKSLTPDDEDNVFSALEQRDRIRHLGLSVANELLEEMVTLMQEPFPELRSLAISPHPVASCVNVPVLPDDFLGGSAPRLRELWLTDIPFPALPTLLSSSSDLVKLVLDGISQTSYIPSAAFAACLAVLPRLEHFSIELESPASPTDRIQLPPETQAILPSLTSFIFTGESAYLEVIMARVDTPQLDSIDITYTDQFDIQVTELSKLVERSAIKPSQFGHAKISPVIGDGIHFCFFRKTDPNEPTIAIHISSNGPIHELVVDMAQVLNQTSAMLSDVVRLEVTIHFFSSYRQDDMRDNIDWLELFRPFTAVKKLRVYEELAESITHALEGRSEEADTRVLPSLKSIYVEDRRAWGVRKLRERGRLLSNGDEWLDLDDSETHRHTICATTIDTLTDDVLLEIFDLIRSSSFRTDFPVPSSPVWDSPPIWKWHPLVHVCRRWREIILESPLRLDLQLFCTNGTPVRKGLGYWPPTIPIVIGHGYNSTYIKGLTPEDEDNVFAALEQRHRVRHIRLSVTDTFLEKMVTSMREPFPELRHLAIHSWSQNMPILPDGFLGGSAPCLREISFSGIPFPALPTFLSSASDLIKLILADIPPTGYISPAAFAACLVALPRLECLSIEFQSPDSPTDRTHLPLETRVVLPSLTTFIFKGESAYLEVVMTRLDTPQLDSIDITYTDDRDFRATEFSKFIERSIPKPSRFGYAKIPFESDGISFYFFRKIDSVSPTIAIRIASSDWLPDLVLDMARVLNQTSAMHSDVVRLEVTMEYSSPHWRDDVGDDIPDDTEWVELFRPFTAMRKLYICKELAECITRALGDRTEESSTQVLPSLESLCVEDKNATYVRERRERGRLLNNGGEGLDSGDSE
ncbi:hypothetical protein EDB83DRAFT_2681314 [Lactarius deliciosus]|nr:hypothetical protein EDB83DRAFT_2681314 [Lactarius deliciosus]